MDVRNRMADVVKLRCNVCQDFIRMILKEGWQKELYKKAQEEITSNGRFKDKYIPTYEQMRNSENGIDDYSVDDMDVTLITELVEANFRGKFPGIKSVEDVTRIALKELRDDRNRTNHSNENEEADELYLCGLLALCNLREFVRTVDKVEKGIDDEQRLAYRHMYIPKIEELFTIVGVYGVLLFSFPVNCVVCLSDKKTKCSFTVFLEKGIFLSLIISNRMSSKYSKRYEFL